MGIMADPGYELSGTTCIHGWPTGYTPKKLYAGVFGITGPHVPGPLPPPANGIYRMEQLVGSPCVWEVQESVYWARFTIDAINSLFECGHDYPDAKHFLKQTAGNQRWFSNSFQGGQNYTGGYCWVSPRPDYGDNPTIKGVAALAGVAVDGDLLAEVFPKSDGNCVYKFNRKRDKSNFKVLINPSEY